MHRDIKPENILLEKCKTYDRIKLIDFGCSAKIIEGKTNSDFVGTLTYLAPEVIGKKHTEKCDIFSIGCMAYMLVSGEVAFDAELDKDVIALTSKCTPNFSGLSWLFVSDNAKDFCQQSMCKDPNQRPSAQ